MVNINDFKIVNNKSKKYFDRIQFSSNGKNKEDISEIEKSRLGFYLLALECITEEKDSSDLQKMVFDTNFCKTVYGTTSKEGAKIENNDFGMDAYYIDDETKTINLFNFKFQENFSENSTQETNPLNSGTRFFNLLLNYNSQKSNEDIWRNAPFTKKVIQQIDETQSTNEIWQTRVYMVSNHSRAPQFESDNIDFITFKDTFDAEIVTVTLPDIVSFLSERPKDLTAELILDANSLLTFQESELSSGKSFVVKLTLPELMRITCSDPDLRKDCSVEDYSDFNTLTPDLGILYDNVRGYLGSTKYNKNIEKTIDSEPNRFFMYNNGLTLTSSKVLSKPINGRKKAKLTLHDFQVVNGGQTLRSIFSVAKNNYSEENFVSAEVLVRIFETEEDENLTNSIAEFTNSQNQIKSSDLKSISNLQIQIGEVLSEEGINYLRKSGNYGNQSENFEYSISMERLAQIIYSLKGFPDKAVNQKKTLFEKHYSTIFENDLDIYALPSLVRLYQHIESTYSTIESHRPTENYYDDNHQKFLYIIFLLGPDGRIDQIPDAIHKLELHIDSFRKDEKISPMRKLIQTSFREQLNTL